MTGIISSYFAQFMHKRTMGTKNEAEAGSILQRTSVTKPTLFSKISHLFGNGMQSATNLLQTSSHHQSVMALSPAEFDEEELEWEEWDGQGKFWHHIIAGSTAGIVEHVCMYPVDTFKVRQNEFLGFALTLFFSPLLE